MGCGQSSASSPVVGDVNGGVSEDDTSKKVYDDRITLPNKQKFRITVSPASTVVEDDGAGGRPRVQCQDSCQQRPKTGEEGEYEQPEAEFDGGTLGLNNVGDVPRLLDSLSDGDLFEDSEFPPSDTSLYFSGRTSENVSWKRPFELSEQPQLFVEGISRRDVVQGVLGDCWFLSSCCAIAKEPKLIERVVPPDQPLAGDGYRGCVRFSFWRFGDWVDVFIDDRLPTKNGTLFNAKCLDPNEFWVALLEKAYAKLHGSYEALEGGQAMDALVDLTGGLAERFDLVEHDQKYLFRHLYKSTLAGAFITCSRKGDWRQANKADELGLVQGHAYTVTALGRPVHQQLGRPRLVRIRNPWADAVEWNGAWSDSDERWSGVDAATRDRLGVSALADGEFWMEFADFCQQFEEVSVCTLGPDYDKDGRVDHVGQVQQIRSEWVPGETAGGSRNNFDKFATNPQFLLTVIDPTPDENDDEDTDKVPVLVTLMQEYRRSQRQFGIKMAQIGFLLYKVDNPIQRVPKRYFMYHYEDASSGTYINYREVAARLELHPGHYAIIPATFAPDTPAAFMIRVFSSGTFKLRQLPDE
ncbi:calpain-A-like [Pollicipes pollicipes]|uniref:calpain-A-like n=1 Tax=Pollicipes pollicipes TaxID=41117 RepID=UPI0018855DD5|nr:calpain-A-like [Pollicipes pollicipes]XP_037090490.1 calpain-A-like [Pollicipes pollicipes]